MILNRLSIAALALAATAGSYGISGPVPLGWRWTGRAMTAPNASPLLTGNVLIVPIGHTIHALDAITGTELWKFPLGGELEGEFRASPALAGNVVVVSNTNKSVFGLNKTDGAKLWTFLLSNSVARKIYADSDYVYLFTGDNKIVALNAATGSRAWSNDFNINDSVVGNPVMHEGDLFFFTGSSQLVSFSTTRQKPNWALNVGSTPFEGGPVVYDGALFIVSGQQVGKINAKTGRPIWTRTFPAQLAGSVAMTSNGGVVATDDVKCFVFDLQGRLKSTKPIELRGYLAGAPQAVGDLVLVRTRNGAMFLVDPARNDGAVIWEYTTLPIPGMTRSASGTNVGGGAGGGAGAGGDMAAGGGAGGTARAGGGRGAGATTPGELVRHVAILGQLAHSNGAIYGLADEGSVFAWGMNLGVDETGPSVEMLTPFQGSKLAAKAGLNIVFQLADESSGVMSKSIKVTANDAAIKWEYEPGPGYLWIRIRDAGSTTPGANLPLRDGRHRFTVSVADWMGNVTEKSFYLVVDNSLPMIRQRGDEVRSGTGPTVGGGSGGGSGSGSGSG